MRATTTRSLSRFAPLLLIAAQTLTGCSEHTTARIVIDGKTILLDGIGNGHRAQETVQQRVAAASVNALDVVTTAGNIEIRSGADNDTILIRATKYVTGRQSVRELQTYLPKVKVTQRLVGGTLEVKSEVAEGALPDGVGHYVSYVITAPKRLAASLKSVSGDIKVNDLNGGVKANAASGDIEIEAVAGRLDLQTTSGDITVHDAPEAVGMTVGTSSGSVELKNIAGRFEARSTSGDITVEGGKIAANLKAETSSGALKLSDIRASGKELNLDLHSVSGDIDYSGDASKIEAHSSSGGLEINTTAALALSAVYAESISGNLTLKLPGLSSARITARTVSGELNLPQVDSSSDRNDDDQDRHSAIITVGNGDAPVTLTSSSGDISLSR